MSWLTALNKSIAITTISWVHSYNKQLTLNGCNWYQKYISRKDAEARTKTCTKLCSQHKNYFAWFWASHAKLISKMAFKTVGHSKSYQQSQKLFLRHLQLFAAFVRACVTAFCSFACPQSRWSCYYGDWQACQLCTKYSTSYHSNRCATRNSCQSTQLSMARSHLAKLLSCWILGTIKCGERMVANRRRKN